METIVSFAKKLNIAVVAEFVCSADIFEAVKEIGVENAQGYYLGKPSLMREVENTPIYQRAKFQTEHFTSTKTLPLSPASGG